MFAGIELYAVQKTASNLTFLPEPLLDTRSLPQFIRSVRILAGPTRHQFAIMSGNSKVGQHSIYEAGDQRNVKTSEQHQVDSSPYAEGQTNSHVNIDSSKTL